MKAILIILVVALGGLTYKFQLDAKSAKAQMIAAEDAEHAAKTEVKEAAAELKEANSKIEQLEKANAAQLAEIDTLKQAGISGVAASKSQPAPTATGPTPSAAEVVAAAEARLDELKKIYDRNLLEITELRARLDANYSRVSSAIDTLRDNPPTFSEQTKRVTPTGRVIGNAGVRTSAADREAAMAKHKSELDALAAQLAAIEEEQIKLRAREQALDDAYAQARGKIVEE